MYQALYRARRPEVFREILGQEHIVKILKHQIETGTVSHAYLFCGTRGTGKTTTARILAKALNCTCPGERPCGECDSCLSIAKGNFIDVIEIDAASNNGVENIRELRESVKYPPQVGSKKVYIIDEVHMLSTGAFNALLKTLEEPPENVVFILCTTEVQKLPQTILSRCMRLDFKRVPQKTIEDDMRAICMEKGVEITDGAIRLLAVNADGSVRDGLSILDQVLAAGDKKIDRDTVLDYLGTVGDEFFIELTEAVSLHKTGEALVLLDGAIREGKDAKQLMKDWNAHYRNLLITKFMKDPEDLLNMSSENIEKVKDQSDHISFEEIDQAILRISRTINEARWSTQPRILMELDIVALSGARGTVRQVVREVQSEPVYQEPAASAVKREAPISDRAATAEGHKADVKEGKAAANAPSSKEPELPEIQCTGAIITDENINLDDFWRDVMDVGETSNGSFNLIRSWSKLKSLGPGNFVVSVATDFARKHTEEKSHVIEGIVTTTLGRPMRMQVVVESRMKTKKEESPEDISKLAMDTLGLDIIVED